MNNHIDHCWVVSAVVNGPSEPDEFRAVEGKTFERASGQGLAKVFRFARAPSDRSKQARYLVPVNSGIIGLQLDNATGQNTIETVCSAGAVCDRAFFVDSRKSARS